MLETTTRRNSDLCTIWILYDGKNYTSPNSENLVSSVIVTGGVWALFSEKDYQGKQLEYKEDDKLGKGSYILKGYSNDKAKSMKLLRDPKDYN